MFLRNFLKLSLLLLLFVQVVGIRDIHAERKKPDKVETGTQTLHMLPKSPTIPEELIKIFCKNHSSTSGFMVKRDDKIGILDKHYGSDNDYIYSGNPLDKNSTFREYNIKQMDWIAVINKNSDDFNDILKKYRILKMTEDIDFRNMVMNLMENKPSTKHTILRRRDTFIFRSEMRPEIFRKMIQQHGDKQKEMRSINDSKATHKTVIPEVPKTISEEPLPVPW